MQKSQNPKFHILVDIFMDHIFGVYHVPRRLIRSFYMKLLANTYVKVNVSICFRKLHGHHSSIFSATE